MLNKIRFAPSEEAYSVLNSTSGRPSFEARIRAAKANNSQVIPEGDLSEYEWTSEGLEDRIKRNEREYKRIYTEPRDVDLSCFNPMFSDDSEFL